MSLRVSLPSGGSSTPSALALNQHVIASNFTVTAGYAAFISEYIEIADGVELEIGDDSDLEIG